MLKSVIPDIIPEKNVLLVIDPLGKNYETILALIFLIKALNEFCIKIQFPKNRDKLSPYNTCM